MVLAEDRRVTTSDARRSFYFLLIALYQRLLTRYYG